MPKHQMNAGPYFKKFLLAKFGNYPKPFNSGSHSDLLYQLMLIKRESYRQMR